MAQELGFDPVGITSIASLKEGEAAIEKWVAEGRHGTMKYLEDFRKRRERLFSEMPDAKSVICLGVNYFQKTVDGPQSIVHRKQKFQSAVDHGLWSVDKVFGRVARYAWGKDYHKVIAQKHAQLIQRLKESVPPGTNFKPCVDTQPIPERHAALQAGLGFIGKHTGILNAKYGPWLFLSEIVTNLELETDAPSEGDCGTCTHCQKVCPTGALDQDYRIDAKLCISYLTIEHKGVIPRELRSKMKDWIFGCDECMNVCPFTSKQKETTWPEFKAPLNDVIPAKRSASWNPDLNQTGSRVEPGMTKNERIGAGESLLIEALLNLPSNKAYERKFAETPLLRTGLKQMLRNACIVLGNSQSEKAIPLLAKALNHRDSLVRLHAAWALGEIPSEKSKKILEERLNQENDKEVIEEIRISQR